MLDSAQITVEETEEEAIARLEAMTAMEFKIYVPGCDGQRYAADSSSAAHASRTRGRSTITAFA